LAGAGVRRCLRRSDDYGGRDLDRAVATSRSPRSMRSKAEVATEVAWARRWNGPQRRSDGRWCVNRLPNFDPPAQGVKNCTPNDNIGCDRRNPSEHHDHVGKEKPSQVISVGSSIC
jgi:hypothetical protein